MKKFRGEGKSIGFSKKSTILRDLQETKVFMESFDGKQKKLATQFKQTLIT